MSTKHNAIVFTGEMNISNAFSTTGIWNEIDLGGYCSNKLSKVLLYFEIIGGYDDLTEYLRAKIRPKNAINIQAQEVTTRYGDPIGVIECWTDDDGMIEWYSEYEQSYLPEQGHNNTIILQIKIIASLN
jgi:hypothetical protein